MIVTTAGAPTAATIAKARRIAAELNVEYVERRQHSLKRLSSQTSQSHLLVVSGSDIRYYDEEQPALYFHPSMAYVRVKRLARGETDPMLEASGCNAGDAVLDCTAGLASDAFVFSYAVGSSGRVTALESEPVLALLIREGLRLYETGKPLFDEALRRIEVVQQSHVHMLASLPDQSYDIVYFDPMFRQPIHESSGLHPLRSLANHDALTEQSVAHACRVARKAVVLKEHRDSGEFERFGFVRRQANTSKIAYGVITP